ncbi:MAG: hypothetical protein PHR26_03185 [Candidatus ainarchaeum sp.]|nr:hypothetical protein [Candidatus ainarchaeum sp.]MDD3975543.1 hypothetical protein [Candidatus ainarchaeum sp.]
MNIFLISDEKFKNKLPLIRFNINKHTTFLPTFQLGKIEKGRNIKKMFLDKDINILEKCDAILICNFDKGKSKNNIDYYSLMICSIAYYLNKKIYLLYNLPISKNKKEIQAFDPICLDGNLKGII